MADPEIPEAAVAAGAEVLLRHWNIPVEDEDATVADFASEAREVLAAALPHLGVTPIDHGGTSALCWWCGRIRKLLPDSRLPIHYAAGRRCPGSHRDPTVEHPALRRKPTTEADHG